MSDLDDPDDAYDAGDPIPVRLANIGERVGYVADRLTGALYDLVEVGELIDRLGRVRDDLATIHGQL